MSVQDLGLGVKTVRKVSNSASRSFFPSRFRVELAAFVLGAIGQFAASADVVLTVGSTNSPQGVPVPIPIRVTGFTNIATLQFSLHWNPVMASYDGVEQLALPSVGVGTPFIANGTLIISWDDPDGTSKSLADGTAIFFVRLRPIGNPGDSGPVTIDSNPTPLEVTDQFLNVLPSRAFPGQITIDFGPDQPPTLTTQPQSRTVTAGSNAIFSVTAIGTQPLRYQWRHDDQDITGATASSLTLTNVQPPDAGDYTVVVTNAAGAITSAVARLTVFVPDLTAPTVAITSPTSSPTLAVDTNILSIAGTASDNAGVTQVSWSNNRGGSGIATGTTNWSVAGIVLQQGTNVLTVTAIDAVTNAGSATLTVIYTPPPDTTPPTVTITGPTSLPTLSINTNVISLAGTASDNVGVTEVGWSNDRGGGGVAVGTTNWGVAAVSLQIGTNVLTVTARDAATNINIDTLTIIYTPPPDTTRPTVTITTPTSLPTFSVNTNSVSVAGLANDNVGVVEVSWSNDRGGGGIAAGTTNWSIATVSLQLGTNVLRVTARDAANNIGSNTLTLIYTLIPDTNSPTVAITVPTSLPTFSIFTNVVSLAGVATDDVGVVQVSWSNDRGGSGLANGTANWSVAAVSLQLGTNVLTVTARDAANNSSTDTLIVTSLPPPDTSLPTIAITFPTAAPTLSTNGNVLSLGGNASDNVAVSKVTWSNNRGGGGVAIGTTNWSVSSIALQGGTNILTVTASDPSSNAATATLTVTYTGPTGQVSIVSGRLSYYPNSSEAVPGALVTSTGSADLSTVTDSNGVYSLGLSQGGNFTVQPIAPAGDSIAAGVTSVDISLIRRHIINAALDSPYKLLAADVNGSRTVSSSDITSLRRMVLGLASTLPSGPWRFVSSDYVFPDTGNPWVGDAPGSRSYSPLTRPFTNQNFYAIKMGDVNFSWRPCGPGSVGCGVHSTLTNRISFALTSHTNQPAETIAAQVVVKSFRDVTSIQFTVGWDPSVVRFRSVGSFLLPGLASGSFNTANAATGKLAVSWDDPSAIGVTLDDDTALFAISFDVVAGSFDASPLTFANSADALPSSEVGVNFQPAVFQAQDGYVSVFAASAPPISPVTITNQSSFAVSIETTTGRVYILEYTDSLSNEAEIHWEALPGVAGNGAVMILSDSSATNSQRFYRVRVE